MTSRATESSEIRSASVKDLNPETHKSESYPLFDWLRFVLASVVVFSHAGFEFAFLSGGLAVSVFFALSGWLIGGILLRTQLSELPRFFFNRSTRIWIPYFIAIALVYGIAVLREGVDFFWVKYLVLDLTVTHQLFTFFPIASYEMPLDGSGNQFWSISVEEQFYLIAPLVILYFSKNKALVTWMFISLVTILLNSHFGAISLGVCAAIAQRDYKIASNKVFRAIAYGVLIVSGVILASFETIVSDYAAPFFSVSLVIILAIAGKRSKLALCCGGLSYPLYLNHWLGLFFVHGVAKKLGLLDLSILPIFSYLVAIIVALPLYWFVDKNIIKYRNYWFTEKLGKRLAVTAYSLVILGIITGSLMYFYGPHAVIPNGVEVSISH